MYNKYNKNQEIKRLFGSDIWFDIVRIFKHIW